MKSHNQEVHMGSKDADEGTTLVSSPQRVKDTIAKIIEM